MAIDKFFQSFFLLVQCPLPLLELTLVNFLFVSLAFALLVQLYSFRSHDPNESPLYGRGDHDLQAALQKGYEQVRTLTEQSLIKGSSYPAIALFAGYCLQDPSSLRRIRGDPLQISRLDQEYPCIAAKSDQKSRRSSVRLGH